MECEDCNDRGWVNSYSYGSVNKPDGYYIEHCGSCSRFKSDQEARDGAVVDSYVGAIKLYYRESCAPL